MDFVTSLLLAGVALNVLVTAALILAGPIYAWNDRWLDRTHKTTADEDRE